LATRREDALLLTVADTGVGIPPADRARVFEKFERGVRRSGAGLGLSLVKHPILSRLPRHFHHGPPSNARG
jgi:signal transduction histidine kinase